MRRFFLAVAALPLAAAVGMGSLNKTASTESAAPNKALLYDANCTGNGPFLRAFIDKDNHIIVYNFTRPYSLQEARRFLAEKYRIGRVNVYRCQAAD